MLTLINTFIKYILNKMEVYSHLNAYFLMHFSEIYDIVEVSHL